MEADYISKKENPNNEYMPSILQITDEKYSNIKIIDQKPIIYKGSPFEARKRPKNNIANDYGYLVNQQYQSEPNSQFSEEISENLNKNRKMIEDNYIIKPYYTTNREFKKLKTQPNIKMNYKNKNNQNDSLINNIKKINLTNNNQKNITILPPKIIYNNNNLIDYNENTKYIYKAPIYIQKNHLSPDYYLKRVQNKIVERKKKPEENISKKREDQIRMTNSDNRSSLSNVSFSNKNIETNYFKRKKQKYSDKVDFDLDKLKAQIDPNILKQYRLIRAMENNRKIEKLEREKEKLSRENTKLNNNYKNFSKDREQFEKEKKLFMDSKTRVLNKTKKNEERLLKLQNDLQEEYQKKKREIEEMRNKIKQAQNNLESERYDLRNTYHNKLAELENEFKIKEDNQNYNNNLNIDKTKREKEMINQKEKEINDLKNNYIQRENNLKMKENELKKKEIELQNKELDLNLKFQAIIQKEQDLLNEKEKHLNNSEENQKGLNMKSQELRNREEQLLNKENQLINRENELKNKENEIKNKEDLINNQENELNNRQNELINKQNELNDRQNEIYNHQNEINDKEKQLDLLNKEIQDKQNKISELNDEYNKIKSSKNTPYSKKNENVMIKGPKDIIDEARPSITVKRIKKQFGVNDYNLANLNHNLQNLNNDPNIFDKVDTFGPIKEISNNNINKDIKDNDDYPENNLKDLNDNDDYPENNLKDLNDNDDYPENNLNDIKDNDNFPENNLNDIKDNDNFPENQIHDIQDNDNFPENQVHDIQDNDNFPENQVHDIQDNNSDPEKQNNNMNYNLNNNILSPQKNQFNDDEDFYGEDPYEIKNQSEQNLNNKKNEENKNEEEELFGNDFDQFINNQNNSEESEDKNYQNNNRINQKNNISDKKEDNNIDSFFNENNNDIVGDDFHDNNLQNNGQKIDNKNNNYNNPQIKNKDLNQNQSENFSLDLSSKNNNLPTFQDNKTLNKKNSSYLNNSQGLKGSNNIQENGNNSESGEIDLKKLKHEEGLDLKESNNFNAIDNLENQKENEKESEIDEITEELFIEEYNPSLGLTKSENPKYLNSVIQCFAHIPDITDKIINLHNNENFQNNLSNLKLTKRYRNLLINLFFPEKMYNVNRQAYNPNSFRNTLNELNPLFKDNENIELKEFINYLILKLHDELNIKKNNNGISMNNENINKKMENKNENDVLREFLQNFTTKNHSILSKSLYGITKYTFYCHQCQKSFFNFECYSYLYFNLDKIIEYKQSKYKKDEIDLNLKDCLEYYQKPETLIGDKGLYCPSCLQQTESTSIKNIYSTKNVLIFILDRNIGNNFNECNITFKESLNVRDYVEYKKEGGKQNEKFFLGGVVNFIGDNYGNETYNAYIKMGKNNDWYCYDDENVYSVSFQDIKNNGYPIILFYHKLIKNK